MPQKPDPEIFLYDSGCRCCGRSRGSHQEPGPFRLAPWKSVSFCSQIAVEDSNLTNPATLMIQSPYSMRSPQ